MQLPKVIKIKQKFPRDRIDDVPGFLKRELANNPNMAAIPSGASIAVTVGSRGITNRVAIIKTIVDFIKERGARPFVVGAMGSHGGGTPEGQLEVLHSLGFSEELLGCPILTSSTVLEVGKTPGGFTVYCDKNAWNADGVVVVNRVKLHTAFRGPNESGLLKMITVGLGKVPGAAQLHRQGPLRMSETVQEVGKAFIQTGKVVAGVAIVENGFDETARLVVLQPGEIVEKERELLKVAKEYFPRLPVDELDLLVVRRMGKNFSGTGMDTNVIGRTKIFGVPEPDKPKVARIVVLDLDDASHGNATGIGLADITTERLYRKLDKKATYLNCLTSTFVQRAMIPMIIENDREAIFAAVRSLALEDESELRLAVIDNTLDLETLYLSASLWEDVEDKAERVSEPFELAFEADGTLDSRITFH